MQDWLQCLSVFANVCAQEYPCLGGYVTGVWLMPVLVEGLDTVATAVTDASGYSSYFQRGLMETASVTAATNSAGVTRKVSVVDGVRERACMS